MINSDKDAIDICLDIIEDKALRYEQFHIDDDVEDDDYEDIDLL